MNPPDNLPPLPPVPPGFDRWEYHPPGSGWKSDTPRVWGAILTGMTEWQLNDSPETACGTNSLHYIEAVRDPAKDATCSKCEAERIYYDGWNCPTEGCDLPAKEPAAGEPSCVYRDLCAVADPADHLEQCLACPRKTSGVEARVCEDIAARQRLVFAKYGVELAVLLPVEEGGGEDGSLDLCVYLKAELERRQP